VDGADRGGDLLAVHTAHRLPSPPAAGARAHTGLKRACLRHPRGNPGPFVAYALVTETEVLTVGDAEDGDDDDVSDGDDDGDELSDGDDDGDELSDGDDDGDELSDGDDDGDDDGEDEDDGEDDGDADEDGEDDADEEDDADGDEDADDADEDDEDDADEEDDADDADADGPRVGARDGLTNSDRDGVR